MNDMSLETWIDFVKGNVKPDVAAELSARLSANDGDAVAMHEWAKGFCAVSDAVKLPAPPERVQANVLSALRTRTRKPSLLKRIQATLSFDSWEHGTVAVAGARSASSDLSEMTEEPRQLLFSANALDISLEIEGNRVSGQLLGTLDEWYTVVLQSGGREVAITTTAQFGEFSFPTVDDGAYTLLLTSPQNEIAIAELTV